MRLANKYRLITAIHIFLPFLAAGFSSAQSGLFQHKEFQDVLGIAAITGLFMVFLSPHLPGLSWLITSPLRRIMAFCKDIQDAKDPYFHLPPEHGEENELLTLMRHMNWMARKIRIREAELASRVAERTQALEIAYHQLEKARDAAEAASRAKDSFLATMSHEIRTPLNAISGMCAVLLSSSLSASQSEQLRVIQTASQALLDQMNATLDFSRIHAGQLPLNPAPFRVREMVEEVSAIFAAEAGKKGLELIADVASEVPVSVSGDGQRLRQVLINLMGNALKFTESGEICLSVNAREERLTFRIEDTGIGIPEKAQVSIFLPFTQADGSITRQYGGAGLGLAICKGIVEQMGGRIRLESEEGRGSAFSFSLPLPALPQCENRPQIPENLKRLHCLVVEDHPITRRVLGRYLSDFGFSADFAHTGSDLRKALDHGPIPDLILLDSHLKDADGKDRDGLALCRELAEKPDLPPVILMGGWPGEEGLALATPGCLAFLAKPLRPSTLFDTIMEIFGSDIRIRPCAPPPFAPNLKGLKVLLVEDNSVNRLVAEELLLPAGIQIKSAVSGKEALTLLRREAVDVVLMDVRMQGMDGRETTRKIRSISGLESLPIIALTADAGPAEEALSLKAGMDAHLTKPLQGEALFAILERFRPQGAPFSETPPTPPPSLDTRKTIGRFLGNESLYQRVLEEFARNQADFPGQILKALEKGDKARARLLAHTLKGTAANIGAQALSLYAAELESRILQNQGPSNIHMALDSARQALEEVLAQIRKSQPPEASLRPGHALSSDLFASALSELDALFAGNRMNAKAKTAELESSFAACNRVREFRRLMDAAERYDFQNARKILAQIRADLLGGLDSTPEGALT
ncbi:hybrid sensor histidine kinase/response regulator [Desulfobotulus sp.]|jgi:signal transduction histidine kinase/DNA-binding response OmpR family regulator/HPt (histidine-containing phosphotransfer) domain-containing protein|uniref:hybrid sensor histidine kinase/response regulator n=1 Tax=Desulfobotulus sp. TaxID=1940337 RepID=UPI002A36E63B|nr:response regulator [Desulfobotulus sp.]MDY0163048.1 response regulator [Desulfobotulus sp.]